MAKYGSPVTDPSLIAELEGNAPQASNSPKYGEPVTDPNLLQQLESNEAQPAPQQSLRQQIADYLPKPGIPPTLNAVSGLMSLISKNPAEQNIISNLPQIAMGKQPTDLEGIEQSIGRNAPSFAIPEAKIGGFIPQALSRIAGQTGWGALTSNDSAEGAKQFGLTQSALEGVNAPVRAIGSLAEAINPRKFAGKIAEEIRNLANKGLSEGEKEYAPVHAKYDTNLITTMPKDYLGFHPEDTQYFKPEVNRAFRDFKAEPTFENLHALQSVMGKYPELKPLRDSVKQKIQSYLSQDKPMLNSYNRGSDILKEKYYPYVSTNELKDIVEHERPITEHDPAALSKGLKTAPVVENAGKALLPGSHPLVGLSKAVQDKLNQGQLLQYGVPMTLGAAIGHGIDPVLGALSGISAGSIFGKYAEPQLLKQAQNPALRAHLENLRKVLQGAGRTAVGYNMSGG